MWGPPGFLGLGWGVWGDVDLTREKPACVELGSELLDCASGGHGLAVS